MSNDFLGELTKNTPEAVLPIYFTPNANDPVSLFNGKFSVVAKGIQLKATGMLEFRWLPSSRINFDLAVEDTSTYFQLIEITELSIVNSNSARCIATRQSERLSGVLNSPLLVGSLTPLDSLKFHLTNIDDLHGSPIRYPEIITTGRVTLLSDDWEFVIDPVVNHDELKEQLKSRGGYAITHVGVLKKTDGATFSFESANEQLEILYYLLSFTYGRWIAPLLRVGLNGDGRRVVEEWADRINDEYEHYSTWFSYQRREMLPSLFPRFAAAWKIDVVREALRKAIWWYVASFKNAGGLDGSLILTQVALESLAWTRFVERDKILSSRGFKDLTAADKLRLVVNSAKIDLEVPVQLAALKAFVRPEVIYGPWAFTEIRNAIVHPTPMNRSNDGGAAFYDAWRLGMWYLELLILHFCGYEGVYRNRLNAKWAGDVEMVPWGR